MRLAITLRRGVTVVQVREERPVGRTKILPVQAQGIEVQVVLKAHQVGAPVHGINSGAGEGAVESVDRAGRQGLRTGNSGWRHNRLTATCNGLYQRRSK